MKRRDHSVGVGQGMGSIRTLKLRRPNIGPAGRARTTSEQIVVNALGPFPAQAHPVSRSESICEQFSKRPSQQSARRNPTKAFTTSRLAE